MYYPGPPVPSPATRAIDEAALSNVFIASILALLGGALGVITLFGGGPLGLYSTRVTNGGSSFQFGALFLLLTVGSAALGLAIILLMRTSFHRLAPVDHRFSTPSTLSLLLIAGLILFYGGFYPFLLGLQAQTACLTNGTSTPPAYCPASVDFLVGIALVAIGGVIALVGLIGMLLGIWRLGSRYNNDLFKVGAILLIFPVLSLVGGILILVASHSERERVSGVRPPHAASF